MTGRESTEPDGVPFRHAMRVLIGERWEAVWKALPAALASDDPEGVHDLRVASRRLRAAMDVTSDAFPNDWYRRLSRVARRITRKLGAVRDRDVMLEALRTDRDTAPPEEWPGIDLLISRVERERQVARSEAKEFLASLESSGVIDETRRRFGERDSHRKKQRQRHEAAVPDQESDS